MVKSVSTRTKKSLLAKLDKLYPSPKSELQFKNPYQLLIAVMLSAQCTDKKVNETTPALFTKYPSFAKLASARVPTLEKLLRPVNYYKTKAKNIAATAKIVSKEYNGRLPRSHKELTSFPGVGNKTANVVLGELGVAATFPVDTHVFRVSRRLGLTDGKNVLQVEEDLKAQFDPKHWRNFHHWLILHGRRVCKAQRPLCGECALSTLCRTFKENG